MRAAGSRPVLRALYLVALMVVFLYGIVGLRTALTAWAEGEHRAPSVGMDGYFRWLVGVFVGFGLAVTAAPWLGLRPERGLVVVVGLALLYLGFANPAFLDQDAGVLRIVDRHLD